MRGGGGGARQGCLCGSLERTGYRMATVGGSVASARKKGSLSCCSSSFLWKEHHRLPSQQTQEPSQEAVSPECGEWSSGWAGVGRGEDLLCEPDWAADGKACSSMATSLCHCSRRGLIFFSSLNLLLREICDYIFFLCTGARMHCANTNISHFMREFGSHFPSICLEWIVL